MKKLFFVYNAKSGKARIRRHLADIIDIFIKSGYMVETYQTQKQQDAMIQVQKRGYEFDMIVCSGGDGTLNEVITGLVSSEWYAEKRVPVGYIPAGSTNDFAVSIGLPKNMVNAALVAMNGKKKNLDVGTFNSRSFVYVAAFGAFTDVSYSTSQELKNVLGHRAYVLESIKEFVPTIQSTYNITAIANGKKLQGKFIYGMVSNSQSVGGFKGITGKNIGFDDGVFEVTLVKPPTTPFEFQEIVTSLLTGKKSKMVYRFKTSKIKVYSEDKIDWVVDGEFGGSVRKAVIKNHHRAINMVTGENICYK
jgi:YegS/Rv2252/BmrU family lipid kinase